MTLASLTAILCSVGFLAIGWKLKGWEVAAQKRRADAAREREFATIMRLAAEEEDARSQCVAVFDRWALVEVHRDERLTSPGGFS